MEMLMSVPLPACQIDLFPALDHQTSLLRSTLEKHRSIGRIVGEQSGGRLKRTIHQIASKEQVTDIEAKLYPDH